MRNSSHRPERSARDTIEGALFLFALTLIVIGTLGGLGMARVAGVGCVGTE